MPILAMSVTINQLLTPSLIPSKEECRFCALILDCQNAYRFS